MITVKETTSLFWEQFNSDGIHLNDKTKPALKPDAKTRRKTEGTVNVVERLLQSAGTSARLSERNRRRPGANRTAYKMQRASRTLMFSSRKKPPYAANFRSEGSRSCNDTSGKSALLSLRASDPNLNTPERHLVRDFARMDLKLLLNLVRSETTSVQFHDDRPSRRKSCNQHTSSHRTLQEGTVNV